MSACTINGCAEQVHARGWCSTHLARRHRNQKNSYRPLSDAECDELAKIVDAIAQPLVLQLLLYLYTERDR